MERYPDWAAREKHSGQPFMQEKRHAKIDVLIEKYISARRQGAT
jgi:hypothetical protein